jgi:Tol biopolymer transport system component
MSRQTEVKERRLSNARRLLTRAMQKHSVKHRGLRTIAAIAVVATGVLSAQNQATVELEGAIVNEQVSGDLNAAIAAYQKIANENSAPRSVKAKALLRLAGCYEKLGQEQSRKVYEQIVRDYGDQPAAAQARARLASYETRSAAAVKNLTPHRLTSNTPELTIQSAGLSPDGKFLAYSDQLGVHIRSMATLETRLLEGTQNHLFLRWLQDGRTLQTQVENKAGEKKITEVSADGRTLRSFSTKDLSVSSPNGVSRAKESRDLSRISIQTANGGPWQEIWAAPGKHTIDQFEWNPTSRAIAILSLERGPNGYQSASTLELVEIGGGRKRKTVLVGPKDNLVIGAIAWSSSNRLLMTINDQIGPNQYESNLWELRFAANGTDVQGGLKRLTDWKDFPIRGGCLSTDGKRIVFIRSFRQRDVYVAPLENGGTQMGAPRRLTLDLGDDYPSDWTRDSKTVIVTSTRNGPQSIFRQEIDKETAEQIVHMPGHQVLGRVTPDGASVLFMAMDANKSPQGFHLMVAPIQGGSAVPVPNTPNPGIFYRCSPAGVCLDAQKNGDGEYVVSELSLTRGMVREIYRDRHMEHPDVSPDGRSIADSTRTDDGLTKIVIRSFATGEVTREIPVPNTSSLFSFGYAPDGKGYFVSDVWLTEARELYVDLSGNISVLYREPVSVFGIWGIPSPDGKFLALVLVTDDSNVYLIENLAN